MENKKYCSAFIGGDCNTCKYPETPCKYQKPGIPNQCMKILDSCYQVNKMREKLQSILNEHGEGLVFLGAGGPKEDWMNGVHSLLLEEGIVSKTDEEIWTSDNSFQVQGRTDLVLTFTYLKMDKLAMWRIRFENCMWLSDYIDNTHLWSDKEE